MTRIFHPWSKIRNLRRRSGWRTGALSIGMSLVLVSSVNLATNAGIASAAANDFGTTTVGSSTDTGDGQSITCNRYAATTSGTVSSISVNVGNVDPASKGYSLAIYADASSNPSSLLGQATGTLTASSWNTLSVSASVTSGGFYWLCYNSNTTSLAYNNVRYASGTTPAIYKDQSYGTWPSPFGTVGARWTDSYSIYATVGSATQVAPVFTAASPPGATVGVAYTYTFTASGSPAPSFSVASGTLPSGLTLNSVSGVLSGNPTTAGTSTFTVKASNTAGSVTSASITLTTTSAQVAPVFTAATPPGATVGVAYTYTFTASGSPAPSFSVASGTLPSCPGTRPRQGPRRSR